MKFPFSDRLPKLSREEEEKRARELSEMKPAGAGEKFTMIWTAFLWIFLPCVGVLLLIVFLAMLLFGLL